MFRKLFIWSLIFSGILATKYPTPRWLQICRLSSNLIKNTSNLTNNTLEN